MRKDKFREARLIRRLTQDVLGKRTHISQARISLIENGLYEPSDNEKQRLARTLGTSVHKIFPTKPRKPKRNDDEGSILTGAVNER